MNNTNWFRKESYTLGTFLTIGSPVITEIAAMYSFQWLLLDMEHGGLTESAIVEHLKSNSNPNMMSIVRVPALDPVLISKILDAGADGIMVPHVVSAEQMELCKQFMYYPPNGKRGFSSSVRQYKYGLDAPGNIDEIPKPLLFAQIEDVEGVLNAEEIAKVEGVDVLFVGPADLKLSLKHNLSGNLDYETSLERVAKAALTNNKKAGILIRDRTQTELIENLGYKCIAVDSDIAILRAGYQNIIKDFSK